MKYIHRKIDLEKDKEYILERHCRINYECDTPWARNTTYDEYRAKWFADKEDVDECLSALKSNMQNINTIAEIIKTIKGEIVGFLWVPFRDAQTDFPYAEIQDIYIEKPFRRKGIATYLFEYAEKKAKENGAKVIRSGTGIENINSIKLHEKTGYYQYRIEYEKLLNK